jgi:hypothetical protein
MAKGLIFYFFVFTCWTIYVIKFIRSDNMINVSKSAIKEIAKTSKDLALDLKKHEYDEEKMKMAQRQMFVVL